MVHIARPLKCHHLPLGWTTCCCIARSQLTKEENIGPRRRIPDAIPERYRVQDGDDLTGIATRLYGHPQAASALWQVNADRLSNPEVLPIGFEMIVPPAWRVFGNGSAFEDSRQIEPSNTTGAKVPVQTTSMPDGSSSQRPGSSEPAGGPWLGSPQTSANSPRRYGQSTQPRYDSSCPGETLASLAQRVYGDAQMADAIFDANRDHVRSLHYLYQVQNYDSPNGESCCPSIRPAQSRSDIISLMNEIHNCRGVRSPDGSDASLSARREVGSS